MRVWMGLGLFCLTAACAIGQHRGVFLGPGHLGHGGFGHRGLAGPGFGSHQRGATARPAARPNRFSFGLSPRHAGSPFHRPAGLRGRHRAPGFRGRFAFPGFGFRIFVPFAFSYSYSESGAWGAEPRKAEPEPSAPAADAPSPQPVEPAPYAIVLRNFTVIHALSFWAEDDRLHYVDPHGEHREIAMKHVHRRFTELANYRLSDPW